MNMSLVGPPPGVLFSASGLATCESGRSNQKARRIEHEALAKT